MSLSIRILLLATLLCATGCAHVKRGSLDAVAPVTDNQRVGNVFLVRGWMGIFSTGMDSLGEKIRAEGIHAEVYQGEQTRQLARAIAAAYADRPDAEPLILVGHSYGADNVLRIARELEAANIKVDLLVTFDPVTPPPVPGNIRRLKNYFKPNGAWDNLPWLRGIPLQADADQPVRLVNIDLTNDRPDLLESNTNHFNIEKNAKVHDEVLRQLKAICPPRPVWAAQRMPDRWTWALPAPAQAGHTELTSALDD